MNVMNGDRFIFFDLIVIVKSWHKNVSLMFSVATMIIVNGIKIDIEYDAPYWHKDKGKDRRRDEFIKSCGYKILRIKGNTTIPTLKDIVDKIDILINTDKKYEKIQLV